MTAPERSESLCFFDLAALAAACADRSMSTMVGDADGGTCSTSLAEAPASKNAGASRRGSSAVSATVGRADGFARHLRSIACEWWHSVELSSEEDASANDTSDASTSSSLPSPSVSCTAR